MIQINLEHDTITVWNLARSWSYLNTDEFISKSDKQTSDVKKIKKKAEGDDDEVDDNDNDNDGNGDSDSGVEVDDDNGNDDDDGGYNEKLIKMMICF